MPQTVVFPRHLQNRFKVAAKKAFPVEEYAFLIGRREESGDFRIEELHFPPERLENSSPNHVEIHTEWFRDAQTQYYPTGLMVLGDIHSHCYDARKEGVADLMPSEQDIRAFTFFKENAEPYYSITGILRLVKKAGRIRADMAMFPPIVPYTVSAV